MQSYPEYVISTKTHINGDMWQTVHDNNINNNDKPTSPWLDLGNITEKFFNICKYIRQVVYEEDFSSRVPSWVVPLWSLIHRSIHIRDSLTKLLSPDDAQIYVISLLHLLFSLPKLLFIHHHLTSSELTC